MAWSSKRSVVVMAVALCVAVDVASSDWVNDYDQPESFDCPHGQFLSHINSEHNNHNEDRHWSFGCRDVPVDGTIGNCHKTNYINNFDATFAFQCSDEGFITGIESVHNNHYEDRRFKFMCCNVPGAVAHNCYFTAYENVMDGILDFEVPTPKILRGMESYHSNHNEDRRFKFEICDYEMFH